MASNIRVDNMQLHVMPAKEKDVTMFLSIRCLEPQLLQPDESPVMHLGLRMPRSLGELLANAETGFDAAKADTDWKDQVPTASAEVN